MKRAVSFFLPAVVLMLAGASCDDKASNHDADSGLCPDGLLHECCTDDDCTDDEVCNEDFECELACLQQDEDCVDDRGGCCDGLACDVFAKTCVEVCVADEECPARHPDVEYRDDLLSRWPAATSRATPGCSTTERRTAPGSWPSTS